MRNITDHIVKGDSANHQLTITVTDEPGQGGANHRYEITGFDTDTNPASVDAGGYKRRYSLETIIFQNGPIKEVGVNGLTHEALLAIVADRLKSFQAGPYACKANEQALMFVMSALFHLQGRTRERIARQVEGTHQV